MDLSDDELIDRISNWDGEDAHQLAELLNEYEERWRASRADQVECVNGTGGIRNGIMDEFSQPINDQFEPEWFDFDNWADTSPIVASSDDRVVVKRGPDDSPGHTPWVTVGEHEDNFFRESYAEEDSVDG